MAAITIMHPKKVVIDQISTGGRGATPAGRVISLSCFSPECSSSFFLPDHFKRFFFDRTQDTRFHLNSAIVDPARAKQEQAEIHWGDETGVNNEAYNARGFAPKGKTPVVRLNAKRSSINMISSITNQGKSVSCCIGKQ